MTALGCTGYVKTIYLGYEVDQGTVTAIYPRHDHVELAMALEPSLDLPGLRDATHLKWRTLPVSMILSGPRLSRLGIENLSLAHSRVSEHRHDVDRDPEFFRALRYGRQRHSSTDRTRCLSSRPRKGVQ